MEVAPTTNTLRKASSPARVMPPSLTLPAVEWSFGVKPIQAANSRPARNSSGAGVFIISRTAPIGPTLGILSETSAAFVGLMPGHELGVDFVNLRLQPRIFCSLGREQLPSKGGHALISLNTLEQRNQVSLTLGGGETELGRVATDGIRKLRAIADQPITQPDHHQGCLLLSCLYRHETHCRPTHRLAKRLGVGAIILAPLHIRLDQLGRY